MPDRFLHSILIAIGLASAIAMNGPAMGTDVVTLASSKPSEAPYGFRDSHIEIVLDSTPHNLADRMREAHVGPPIMLALEDIGATKPPGDVYKVFMGVVGSDPSLRAAQFLGYLSLYDLKQQTRSFDATKPIGELLTIGGDLNLVVTIRAPDRTESQEPAEITIGRARLIAQ
jgi:hypothetical protein